MTLHNCPSPECAAANHRGQSGVRIGLPEPVEATRDEAIHIAGHFLHDALRYLEAGDTEHAAVWIDSALIWMGER